MRVSIVGSGYVGLVTGLGLAEVGHEVVCVDNDKSKLELINSGMAPFYEEGIAELLGSHIGGRLRVVDQVAEAVGQTDLTLIAVGTPFDGERIELRHVEQVSKEIGRELREKSGYHVVVVKSTVVPGTTESVVLPLLEEHSGKDAGTDFGVGTNPEFLREGNAVADFMDPDRIVIGGIDERTREVIAKLYEPFAGADVLYTSPRTAEMIKYAANSLLATLISFSNEIANLSARIGVDAMEVMHGVHLDRRFTPIREDGSRVWPGFITYLKPGCGFGGSCFPKDVKSLISFGEEYESSMRILKAVIDVNESQPAKMLELLSRHFDDLEGISVTMLGMSFKPDTDDIRESPSVALTGLLLANGARVGVFDPVARDAVFGVFGQQVSYPESLEDAVRESEAVLLMTGWRDFERLPEVLRANTDQPVVVDGRRILEKESVDVYEGIGL